MFFTLQRYTPDLFESHIVNLLVWPHFYGGFFSSSRPAHFCSKAVVCLDTLYENGLREFLIGATCVIESRKPRSINC